MERVVALASIANSVKYVGYGYWLSCEKYELFVVIDTNVIFSLFCTLPILLVSGKVILYCENQGSGQNLKELVRCKKEK